jgi:hypothetical protein
MDELVTQSTSSQASGSVQSKLSVFGSTTGQRSYGRRLEGALSNEERYLGGGLRERCLRGL